MINQRYRLIEPRRISTDFVVEQIKETDVVVRPTYLSICAADERYYQGLRDQKILDAKLPMCLIHEAVGTIVKDSSNRFKPGTEVVMVPNIPQTNNGDIKDNYALSTKFSSSSSDGFMRQLVVIDSSRVVPYSNISNRVAVLLELMSVAMNAVSVVDKHLAKKPIKGKIGIWGNGSVGFMTALVLKYSYPEAKLVIFGTDYDKLNHFSFADEIYKIDEVIEGYHVDYAFECVGGSNSGVAINQIIDLINPQGVISLLGVSEQFVEINTRMVLEKGLSMIGHSRSTKQDFIDCINLINQNPEIETYLESIISDEIVVRDVNDIYQAFNTDRNNQFKTIMKWEI